MLTQTEVLSTQRRRHARKSRLAHADSGGKTSFNSFQIALRILKDCRKLQFQLFLVLGVALMSMPLSLLTPVSLKIAVDNVIGAQPLSPLWQGFVPGVLQNHLLLFACGTGFFILALQALQSIGMWIYQRYVGEQLVLEFRSRLFQHIQSLSLSQQQKYGTPDLFYRLQTDIHAMSYFAISGMIPFLTSAVTCGVMFLVAVQIDWQVALLALGVVPILWGLNRYHNQRSLSGWVGVKENEKKAISVIQEALNCIQVIKAFGNEKREVERYRSQGQSNLKNYLKTISTDGAFTLTIHGLLAVTTAVAMYLGVTHVQSGVLSLGSFLVLVTYLTQLLKSVEDFSKQINTSQAALASGLRVYAVLDEPPAIVESKRGRSLKNAVGSLEFQAVSFGYHQKKVLNDVSFVVKPGTQVGIVGPTGAGKSTLLGLMLRFFEPNEGTILIDGNELGQICFNDVRSLFSYVPQEPVLFSGTIAENIAYGRSNASSSEIERVAHAAQAHEFIENLPEGYRTSVGERGVYLSGGQRQRISIARALLMDSPILILDEPTSFIDDKNEKFISDSLKALRSNRTTIAVSHRKALIEDCDLTLKVEGGRVTPIEALGQ